MKLLKIFKLAAIGLLLASLFGCATYRPIVDQNAHYNEVGQTQANRDINECMRAANAYLSQYKTQREENAAKREAGMGAIVGGALGLLGGGNLRSTIGGAAVGGVAGGLMGAGGVAAQGNLTPDQIKERYVDNCLARKGYSVLGWE